jgi:hypothetical protein
MGNADLTQIKATSVRRRREVVAARETAEPGDDAPQRNIDSDWPLRIDPAGLPHSVGRRRRGL